MAVPQTTSFPSDEAMYLVPILRGSIPDDKLKLTHSALILSDYAAYVLLSGSSPSVPHAAVEPTAAEIADHLEAMALGGAQPRKFGDGQVLRWVLKNLPTLLQTVGTIATIVGA